MARRLAPQKWGKYRKNAHNGNRRRKWAQAQRTLDILVVSSGCTYADLRQAPMSTTTKACRCRNVWRQSMETGPNANTPSLHWAKRLRSVRPLTYGPKKNPPRAHSKAYSLIRDGYSLFEPSYSSIGDGYSQSGDKEPLSSWLHRTVGESKHNLKG